MVNNENQIVKHIADIIGEWGKWQGHLFSYCFLMWGASAINNMGYSFHAYDVEFWCSDVPIDYPVINRFISIIVLQKSYKVIEYSVY